MDFNSKNFRYVTEEFGTFIGKIKNGQRMYMRALSHSEPLNLPACIASDFPRLAEDFKLPPELEFITQNTFSSVLRVSGPVNMWLHYDVSNRP
jgi:tRNA wybutosine-synthesizing protein 4